MSAWTWRLADADGALCEPSRSQAFPTRSDAETWIGENWSALLDSGVEQVVLLEEENEVYGPMGLRPA